MTAVHSYRLGPHPVVVTERGAVMFTGRAEPEIILAVFDAMTAHGTLADVLTAAPGVDLAGAVKSTDGTVESVVRGRGMIELADGRVVDDSTGAVTAADLSAATISNGASGPTNRPEMPIVTGVIVAWQVLLTWTDATTGTATTGTVTEFIPAPPVVLIKRAPVSAPQPEIVPESDPKPEPEPEPAPAPQTAEWSTGMNVPTPEPPGRGYDFVWEDSGALPPRVGSKPPTLPPPPPPPPVLPTAAIPRAHLLAPVDHDGNTQMFTSAMSGAGAPAPAPDGRSVLALVCPLNHANPPHFAVCRTCQAPLETPARHISRPVLGMLRTSTGLNLPLDQPVVVGSRPEPRDVTEPERSRLVTVPSPGREISRTHVAIRVDGWHVLAVDLHSTNGTYLLRGGRAPERIPPGSPVLLTSGDALDIGEGVMLHLEGLP